MKNLIERNYQSIVDRGLITPTTSIREFWMKLEEEVQEFIEAESVKNRNEELADIILVCFNIAKHYNIDIEKELVNKIIKNELRAKNKLT